MQAELSGEHIHQHFDCVCLVPHLHFSVVIVFRDRFAWIAVQDVCFASAHEL